MCTSKSPLERNLRNRLVERLALDRRNLELKRRRLARTIAGREGSRSPGGATVHLREVRELRERVLVSERHEYYAVVDEGRERVGDGGLLSATRGCGGDEDTSVLASESTGRPETAGGIPESLRRTNGFSKGECIYTAKERTFHWPGKLP